MTTEPLPSYLTYEDYDFDDLQTYAGIDTLVTSSIVSKIFPAVVEERLYLQADDNLKPVKTRSSAILDSYEDYTSVAFEYILDLEYNGLYYDKEENRRLHSTMLEDIGFLNNRISDSIHKDINLDSSNDLIQLLYVYKGFTAPHLTKSGDMAVDSAALLTLAGLDPLNPGKYVTPNPDLQYLADIAKRKNLCAVHNTFISTYIDDFVKRDGRLHPNYNMFGTSSFRLTGSDPNCQQIPRAFGIKRCYSVEDGNVFIAADFSSAEIKILAAISRDPNMLKAVADNLDFHSFAASKMYHIPYDEFIAILHDKSNPLSKEYKLFRQNSKALSFGILYGSSVGGVALNLNISTEAAKALIDLYFTTFPGIKLYVDKVHLEAKWNKRVITPFGYARNFYGLDDSFKRTAAYNAALRGSQNYKIQGTTATAGLITFANMNREIKKLDGKSILTVHDSAEMEVSLSKAAEAISIVEYYMNDYPQTVFPWLELSIGSEIEFGINWQDCVTVNKGITQSECEVIYNKLLKERNERNG